MILTTSVIAEVKEETAMKFSGQVMCVMAMAFGLPFATAKAVQATTILQDGMVQRAPADAKSGSGEIKTAQVRRRVRRRRIRRRVIRRGVAGGVIVGGVIASQAARADEAAMRRCAEDFKSFDWDTGTYVTYGGEIKVCPYLL